MGHRLLVIAHGHPDFSLGGAEIAAYSLFQEYGRHQAVEAAFFLARVQRDKPLDGAITMYNDKEYLWEQSTRDYFQLSSSNMYSTLNVFPSFLEALKPDIIHIHHVMHLGLEVLKVIKNVNPDIKIYFTLHEFQAICYNQGQMLKKDGRLCSKASYDSCAACFPEYSREDFWLRKRQTLYYFLLVDKFIAPSEFLRQRYIEWGLPEEKICVLENGLRPINQGAPVLVPHASGPNRFGFFGQINQFKGIDTLLRALEIVYKADFPVILQIHGANLEKQPENFQKKIKELRGPLEEAGVLQWIGPYAPDHIASRMANVDWVVVPSIWWENSPVVIQEAFAMGKPVIASDIGGMAEKVKHGVNGLNVEVNNTQAWADCLMFASGNEELWNKLHAGITPPPTARESAAAHLRMMGICDD